MELWINKLEYVIAQLQGHISSPQLAVFVRIHMHTSTLEYAFVLKDTILIKDYAHNAGIILYLLMINYHVFVFWGLLLWGILVSKRHNLVWMEHSINKLEFVIVSSLGWFSSLTLVANAEIKMLTSMLRRKVVPVIQIIISSKVLVQYVGKILSLQMI